MTTDLTIGLINRPGTLAQASDALGRAGVNIDGACGFVAGDEGVYHVLVREAEAARRALMDSGFEIHAERAVVVLEIENRPGQAAQLLRRIADSGVDLDILYTTLDGRIVLGGSNVRGIRRAVAAKG